MHSGEEVDDVGDDELPSVGNGNDDELPSSRFLIDATRGNVKAFARQYAVVRQLLALMTLFNEYYMIINNN